MHILHSWTIKKDTGMHKYEECVICSKRRITAPLSGGYQPIDKQWLDSGIFAAMANPPGSE